MKNETTTKSRVSDKMNSPVRCVRLVAAIILLPLLLLLALPALLWDICGEPEDGDYLSNKVVDLWAKLLTGI